MTIIVQGPTTAQIATVQQPAAAPASVTDWRATLTADGIRATSTGSNVRGDGFIHVIERDGQPSVRLPILETTSPLTTVLRVRMAMGVMPPAATFFASKLSAEGRAQLELLLSRGALTPEESEVRYDGNPDRRLYTKANNLSSVGSALELTFGTDSGDGPGILKLENVGGALRGTVVFEYFGTRATSLDLGR